MRPRRPPRESWSPAESPDEPPPPDLTDVTDLPPPDFTAFTDLGDELSPAQNTPALTSPQSPLTVCLHCGDSPTADSSCSHRDLAHLDAPSPEVSNTLNTLRQLRAQLRTHERILERLIASAVRDGSATLDTRPAPTPLALPAVPLCPKCAEASSRAPRLARRKPHPEAQITLPFRVPREP